MDNSLAGEDRFGKSWEQLNSELYALGYKNAAAILSTSIELPNPSSPPMRDYLGYSAIDPSIVAGDVCFSFRFSKYSNEELLSIREIKASLAYLAADTHKTPKTVFRTYHKSEQDPLPTKRQITTAVHSELALERTKEDLRKNTELKKELRQIGFRNYDKLVDGTTQVLGKSIFLRANIDLNAKIGSGDDTVNFIIWLRPGTSDKSFNIERITGTLESSLRFAHTEGNPSAYYYSRVSDKIPSVEKMIREIINDEKNILQAYAKAYQLTKKMNFIKSKQGRSNQNNLPF